MTPTFLKNDISVFLPRKWPELTPQHALYTAPNFSEGYCTDDNARGLMLTCYLQQPDAADESVQQLRSTFLAFLAHAFDRSTGRFRNFMSFDRRWLEKLGSTDSHGRAIWALGHCLRHASGGPSLALGEDRVVPTRDQSQPRRASVRRRQRGAKNPYGHPSHVSPSFFAVPFF